MMVYIMILREKGWFVVWLLFVVDATPKYYVFFCNNLFSNTMTFFALSGQLVKKL